MEPLVLRLALVAGAVWLGAALLAFFFGERILFQPPPASYRAAGDDDGGGIPITRVPVGDGGAVAVQRVPHPDARHTLLFSHGNAEDLGHLQPLMGLLHAAGFEVVAYDYRGYGRSTGPRPSTRRAIEDAEAVYRHVTVDLGIPPERVIVHGRSLGGGPTLELATRHPVAGVILESTFTSAYRVVTRVPLLPFDRFPNLSRVDDLDVPVLVIHGTRDRVIPVAHGRALHAACGAERCLWVEGAGHNDVAVVGGDSYVEALRTFSSSLAGGD